MKKKILFWSIWCSSVEVLDPYCEEALKKKKKHIPIVKQRKVHNFVSATWIMISKMMEKNDS